MCVCVCPPGCDNLDSKQRSEVFMFALLATEWRPLSSRRNKKRKKKKRPNVYRDLQKIKPMRRRTKGPYLAVSSPSLFPRILPHLPHFPCLITVISAISFQAAATETHCCCCCCGGRLLLLVPPPPWPSSTTTTQRGGGLSPNQVFKFMQLHSRHRGPSAAVGQRANYAQVTGTNGVLFW